MSAPSCCGDLQYKQISANQILNLDFCSDLYCLSQSIHLACIPDPPEYPNGSSEFFLTLGHIVAIGAEVLQKKHDNKENVSNQIRSSI